MQISELDGKKIAILGFGREGRAMAGALKDFASSANVTILDKDGSLQTTDYRLQTGADYLKNLQSFDVIIKSPGIPPQKEFDAVKTKMTTSTQIFLDSIADTGATVIGVTGSKGKSTTSSLIYEILKADGRDVYLVGNIGEPAIKHLKDAKSNTIFVQEMSSYQLMDLQSSPHIAVVTSFFPEHLDYHGTLDAYLDAKKHIARFQTEDDVIFFASSSPACKHIADESAGTKIMFTSADAPVKIDETKLKGAHNLKNIGAAAKVAKFLDVEKKIIVKTIKNFTPLPHRLQSLGVQHGFEWVNDSISTTPQSAIAALEALGENVTTIIVGGQDRGYDFSPLIDALLAHPNLLHVILLPDSGNKIRSLLEARKQTKLTLDDAADMASAVSIAKKQTATATKPIVLLSPASPSYGHFVNFEDRGEQFRSCIVSEQ
jgi:UDP-N-acetylmuramoylalanine--D-glutamate ligase